MKAGAERRQPEAALVAEAVRGLGLLRRAAVGVGAGRPAAGVSVDGHRRTPLSAGSARRGAGSQQPLPAQDLGHVGVGLLRRLRGAAPTSAGCQVRCTELDTSP